MTQADDMVRIGCKRTCNSVNSDNNAFLWRNHTTCRNKMVKYTITKSHTGFRSR